MRYSRLLFALLLAVAVVAAPAAAARRVAPEYVSSEPADGATLHESPEEVVVRFSEPLDGSSTLEVRDACGNRIDSRAVRISLNEMRIGIAKKRAGVHKVSYEAVGLAGLTGTTEGSFSYTVHSGPSCGGDGGPGGHGDHFGGDGDGNGHGDGHGSGSSQHGSSGHTSGSGHAAGGGHPRGDHDRKRGHGGKKGHGGKHGHREGRHGDHGSRGGEETDRDIVAAPPGLPAPDGAAVLVALTAAGFLGALGGFVLRFSAPRS
jgi:methionine-rich copper-binding protein CopC